MSSALREREKENRIKGRKRDGGRGGRISWAQECICYPSAQEAGAEGYEFKAALQIDTRAGEKGMKKEETLMVGKERKH